MWWLSTRISIADLFAIEILAGAPALAVPFFVE
jgi:hypothetical protein